uniref:SH3 domain-containing protein n=1 Tax=Setaria digitata TaxID=48799 RepID=A0A915Q1R9_9BILA
MLSSNQQQHQQQQQQQQQHLYSNSSLTDGTFTNTLSPVMPVMVPMMCMSPTPTTTVTACLSPMPIKKSITASDILHSDDRTLSPIPVSYNYNTPFHQYGNNFTINKTYENSTMTSNTYGNDTMTSNTYGNGTMTSNTYRNGIIYDEHNPDDLSCSSTTMIIRSSPLPETAQSPTNLDEKSRVGQILPTSTKARYVGPVDPRTNECLKSPPLTSKNLHYKEKDQNQPESDQLAYNRNQFGPVETDENCYYDTTIREVPHSGKLSGGSITASTAHPNPPLRRTQPYFRSQPPRSPSPLPRLVPIPETEITTGTAGSNEIVSNNSFAKLNIYGSSAIKNANNGSMMHDDEIINGKKSLRTVVELENDGLRRIHGKHQQRPEFDDEVPRGTARRHHVQMLTESGEENETSPKPAPRTIINRMPLPIHTNKLEGRREAFGEWVMEMDGSKNDKQNQAQTMAEIAAYQDQLSKLQQEQQQQRARYCMQDDNYNKQHYLNNNNTSKQQQQQQQTVLSYCGQDGYQSDQQRERPAVQYIQQPWNLMIRKQIFHPNEQLGEEQEIDLIFAQIISDCRKPKAFQIHSSERDAVSQILRNYRVPPVALDNPQMIMLDVKIAIIQCARRWPFYFTVQFPVMDQLINRITGELVHVRRTLAIHETGLTVLSQDDSDNKMSLNILDHFSYADIIDLQVDNSRRQLRLQTRQDPQLILRTHHAQEICSLIEKMMSSNGGKVRIYVRAIADYVTNEPNLLSFVKGDIIQIINRNDGILSMDQSNEQWLYGRIGNHFGNLPANYVEQLDPFGQVNN